MHVEIVEVGPRDGLQNEKALLSPEDKAELIRRSTAAGLRRVESVSFVSSKAVPQMAAAEEVMARTERVPVLVTAAWSSTPVDSRAPSRPEWTR